MAGKDTLRPLEQIDLRAALVVEQAGKAFLELVEYYRKLGKLLEIDGAQPVEQVTKVLLSALKK